MNDETGTKTPEEMLIDLHWVRFYAGNAARLLLLTPTGNRMVTWTDDTDLNKVVYDGLDWKPSEKDVTILKGRIAEGYTPIGVICPNFDHPNRARHVPSGYLEDEETQRIMAAYEMGYVTAIHMRLPGKEKLLDLLTKEYPGAVAKVLPCLY